MTVVVVDADADDAPPTPVATAPSAAALGRPAGALSRLLSADRVVVWDDPVTRLDVRRRLVDAIVRGVPGLNHDRVMAALAEREAQGSTFLNEGVALPHARLKELTTVQVALGLTHAGVLDADTTKPVEAAFLLLSPAAGANVHLQLLAQVGRVLQDRGLRRALARARTPGDAVGAIQDFEAASSPRASAAVV